MILISALNPQTSLVTLGNVWLDSRKNPDYFWRLIICSRVGLAFALFAFSILSKFLQKLSIVFMISADKKLMTNIFPWLTR